MFSRISFLIMTFFLVSCILTNGQTVPATATPQARPEIKHVPTPYTSPSSGKEMYTAYCASCHGADGKGDGPAAAALKMPPANLTTLAARNGGIFPTAHVAADLQGGTMTPAHGNKAMPVWGPIFMAMGGQSAAEMQLRIRNLTNYLESIQVK
jgi:mono/diheme cytochrome c family protein